MAAGNSTTCPITVAAGNSTCPIIAGNSTCPITVAAGNQGHVLLLWLRVIAQHVLLLWLRVSKDMFPVKYSPTKSVFVSVESSHPQIFGNFQI